MKEIPLADLSHYTTLADSLVNSPCQDPTELIQTTQHIKTIAEQAMKDVSLYAIETGDLTHSAVARCARVHPDTVKKWLTAHEVEHEQ